MLWPRQRGEVTPCAYLVGVTAFVSRGVICSGSEVVGHPVLKPRPGVMGDVAHIHAVLVTAGGGPVVEFVTSQVWLLIGIPGQGEVGCLTGRRKGKAKENQS